VTAISRAALAAVLSGPRDERYWAIRWQYMHGDGFFDALLRAAEHADPENLARIELGFPEIARAVRSWKNVEGWAQEVERWAESLVPKDGLSRREPHCEPGGEVFKP